MASYFMTKVSKSEHPQVNYDSAESISSQDEDEDEDDEEFSKANKISETSSNEHLDPNSFSWCLMRYAIIKYIHHCLVIFLPQIGIEISELPVCSPLVHSIHKTLEQWETDLKNHLEKFDSAPPNYIPGVFIESSFSGSVSIFKYHIVMDPANTPFTSTHYSARPAKRLWNYLVTRDYLQDVFIRYIFRKQHSMNELDGSRLSDTSSTSSTTPRDTEVMKIIHKDQDALTCFCVNEANLNSIVVATQKELLELDITNVLSPPAFLQDDTEYDIEVIRNPLNNQDRVDEVMVIRTPFDNRLYSRNGSNAGFTSPTSAGGVQYPGTYGSSQTTGTSGSTVLLKRSVSGVRRMAAHPILPYYLTGSQDGCVRLWEWGHADPINEPCKPGAFPKVTKVLFNNQGNKFGVSDTEGGVCLWQVGLGMGSLGMNKPFLSFKCHSKVTSDFVFVGSSSLIATAGHSADNRNVCLWDTLLPQRRSLVQAFQCHPDGCPMVLYAPQHQVLVTGGKKGEVCIFDVRQRQLRQTFQAHDANVAIKCMALDSGTGAEECFATGGSDGDIKVWSLAIHGLMYSFPGEHSKGSSSLFRTAGSGVTQLYLSPLGHLFSCGADGSLKVRQLPNRC
jgi:WD40 repeat protein